MTPHAYTRAQGTSVNLRNEQPQRRQPAPKLGPQAAYGGTRANGPLHARRFGRIALGVLVLGALDCSRGARAVRLPSPEADAFIYQIDCHTNIESCRKKAAELCPTGYDLLKSAGAPIEPARVDTEPGPRSTGSRYQRPDWVGQIVVACENADSGTSGPRRAQPDDTAPRAAPARAERMPDPDQVCVPGVTQLCLGAGACRGAQPCLADGRGYGVCDCGAPNTSGAEQSGVSSVTRDAGASQP
jgi:hypothetical protein